MAQIIIFVIVFRYINSISLKLKSEKRKAKAKTAAPIKTEPVQPQKKTNSFFGASTSTTKPQQSTASNAPIKQEKISPKKESPPTKKESPTKNKAKPQQGKSSIATFFSAKSATSGAKPSTAIAQATSDIKNIKIKEESGTNVKVKEEKVDMEIDSDVKESKSDAKGKKVTSPKDSKSSKKRTLPNTSGKFPYGN